MAKTSTPRLVIDACVLFSSGRSEHPTSSACRQFLEAVLQNSYRVAVSKPLLEEWDNHQSPWSTKWRASMVSRRLVVSVQVYELRDLRTAIGMLKPQSKIAVALKDAHLIEIALQADRVIFSLDEKARDIFLDISEEIFILATIAWMNPDIEQVECMNWLDSQGTSGPSRFLDRTKMPQAASGNGH